MTSSNLWFAIIDGKHARLVSIEDNDGIGHPRFAKGATLASDGYRHPPAVRTHWSVDAVIQTEEPQNNKNRFKQRQEGSDRFIAMVAENLDSRHDEFGDLVLVAKPDVAKQMRDFLRNGTRAKLVGTVFKNLCNVPDHELLPHLHEIQRGRR